MKNKHVYYINSSYYKFLKYPKIREPGIGYTTVTLHQENKITEISN